MKEIPFFFPSGDCHLFGVMHIPAASRRNTAFLFCTPFGEEKLWTHLVYVNFARALASHGYPVLRFDYRGTGDSEGNFEDATLESCLADIRSAIEILKDQSDQTERLGLLGLRMGATLAALTAETLPQISTLVLWEPILNVDEYMQDLLRVNLTTQMALYKEIRQNREALIRSMKDGLTANVDGYEISAEMFEQFSSLHLPRALNYAKANCLIIQIASKQNPSLKDEFLQLGSVYQQSQVLLSIEEPFWKEIKPFYSRAERLYQDTLNWLNQHEHRL